MLPTYFLAVQATTRYSLWCTCAACAVLRVLCRVYLCRVCCAAYAHAHARVEQARRVEWARQLRDLDRRLRSSSAEDRPLALVYVHHAAHRLYPDRVKELIRRVCCHTRARTLDEQTPGCCVYHTGLEPRTSRQGPTSRPRRRQVLFCYSHV